MAQMHTLHHRADALPYAVTRAAAKRCGLRSRPPMLAGPRSVCLSVCLSVCIFIYVCMYVCMYVSMYVCMSVCLYVSLAICLGQDLRLENSMSKRTA